MGDTSEKIDVPPRTHDLAKAAKEGFDKGAAEYDTLRPGYTEKSIEQILEEVNLPKETSSHSTLKYEILELGAGTGRLTELIAPRIPPGYRYLATEPSNEFLGHLKSKQLQIETAGGVSASSIPLPDKSVQNIVCGTCLQWFCDEKSLKEIHRVLVPGGKLISLAYVEIFEEGSWMMELYKQRFEALEAAGSSTMTWITSMEWKKALDATGLFTTARQESLPGADYPCNMGSLLEFVRTISCYNALPEDICQSYLERLKQNIFKYPEVDPDHMAIPFTNLLCIFTPKQM